MQVTRVAEKALGVNLPLPNKTCSLPYIVFDQLFWN